jgi:hypothetical protein
MGPTKLQKVRETLHLALRPARRLLPVFAVDAVIAMLLGCGAAT